MSLTVPDNVSVMPVDVLNSDSNKTIDLPLVSESIGRVLTFTDYKYNASVSTITLATNEADVIHNGVDTTLVLDTNGASISIMAVAPNIWTVLSYFNGTV
jgi:hypothetical protein